MERLSEAKRERWFWGITFLLALLPLLGWWLFGLFDLDEGFYAAVTREMLRRGDWITPYFNGNPWFEKPIMLYWTSAPFVGLFGENLGPRLSSVLANLGLYALVGSFVARRLSPTMGRWAVLVLATSPLVAILGRQMMFDAEFTLFLSASLFLFYASLSGGPSLRIWSGALLGLAVLTKGPVAIILWGLLAGVTAWRSPGTRRQVFSPAANAAAFVAMLAVVAIWYVPAYLANGQEFIQKFLIDQNWGRFVGGDKAHALDANLLLQLPIFPLVLLLGMIPWSWRIFPGWPRKVEAGEPGDEFFQFCAHWALVVLVFFSLSGSKLPHYILPAAVPLAILCARTFVTPFFGIGTLLWGILLSLGLNVGGAVYYDRSGQKEAHALGRWLRSQGGPVVAYQLPRRQKDRGTGKLKLQETSLPSLSFYIDAPVRQVEELEELAPVEVPVWVFTREGRITAAERTEWAEKGIKLEMVQPPVLSEHYEVFRLLP